MAISKKLEIIYHNGHPDGIRSTRRHLSTMTTYESRLLGGVSCKIECCSTVVVFDFPRVTVQPMSL